MSGRATCLPTRAVLHAGVASFALVAMPATAQETQREAELEARVQQLEQTVDRLNATLEALDARLATAPPAAAAPASGQAAPAAAPAPAATAPTNGFRVGSTTVRIDGFFKAFASVSHYSGGTVPDDSVGRDFYNPGLIPVGGVGDSHETEFNAKQTRITLSTSTPFGGHTVDGLLEVDFQVAPGTGNHRVTSAYNPGLRRAYVSYRGFLAGQDWTTFQNIDALPETTDFIGVTEGTIFVRQAMFRYTQRLGPRLSLAVAAESPETSFTTLDSTTINGAGNNRVPDLATRLTWTPAWGEVSLAGVARELTVVDTTGARDSVFGWGVSLAGKIPIGRPNGFTDFRFMITHGDGIGRYVGLNFLPDAVFSDADGGTLRPVRLTAGFAALRIGLTDRLRSTVMGSFQNGDYPTGFAVDGDNRRAWSGAINLFYTPIPNFDLGIEFRHGRRELNSGDSGTVDQGQLAVKYTF